MADTFEYKWMPQNLLKGYPPHLETIPPELNLRLDQILDPLALNDTTSLIPDPDPTHPPKPGPSEKFLALAPTNCQTIQDVVDFVRQKHKEQVSDPQALPKPPNMYRAPNIALRDDWYTDAVFGQQTLTGVDPTAITRADKDWFKEFKDAASQQSLPEEVERKLNEWYKANDLFVLAYDDIKSIRGPDGEIPSRQGPNRPDAYGGASVTLFHFEPEGKMHPIAIILDYYASHSEHNVVIFNQRLESRSPHPTCTEATDWPWRYAKTVTRVAGWLGHEVGVHLVKAHLVEEVCLVAAHRAFQPDPKHLVFQLLKPHRDVTFAINNAARRILVPGVIVPAAGFPSDKVVNFLNHTYRNFQWVESYVPRDLSRRGFPAGQLQSARYRNCAWARGVSDMWRIVRNFVSTVLRTQYPGGDEAVVKDGLLKSFCEEMRGAGKGGLTSFPKAFQNLDELTDAVTNIIHIATSQHTSINYLQQYYMTFVPNAPGALYTKLPKTLEELQQYTEQSLLDALPITTLPIPDQGKDFRAEWLLQGQVPYLLSFAPPMDKSLLYYATEAAMSVDVPWPIRSAALTLKGDLDRFALTVREYSDKRDDQTTPYLVLDPYLTTSSIIL